MFESRPSGRCAFIAQRINSNKIWLYAWEMQIGRRFERQPSYMWSPSSSSLQQCCYYLKHKQQPISASPHLPLESLTPGPFLSINMPSSHRFYSFSPIVFLFFPTFHFWLISSFPSISTLFSSSPFVLFTLHTYIRTYVPIFTQVNFKCLISGAFQR